MTVTTKTFLHEVFIRLGPDGFRGAYAQDLTVDVDEAGGFVPESHRLGRNRPLTLEDLTPLIGAEQAAIVVGAQAEAARADAAEAELEAARSRIAELEAALEAEKVDAGRLAAMTQKVEASEILCAAAAKEVDQLRRQVATLTPVETAEAASA